MDLKGFDINIFFAPATKWSGHIVLPLSILPSFSDTQFPDFFLNALRY